MLQRIRASYEDTPADRALRNAICNNDIRKLVVNQPNQGEIDTYFSHRVPSKGVTDQQQSGRCWLFSGLNVLRARMIARYGLGGLRVFAELLFFLGSSWRRRTSSCRGLSTPATHRARIGRSSGCSRTRSATAASLPGLRISWASTGWCPWRRCPKRTAASTTAQMAALLKLKLREYGLSLREAARDGAEKAELESRKTEMLGVIYRMLVLNLGEPPVRFTWTRRDAEGRPVDTREYTPRSFFRNLCRRRSHGQLCHADERSHARLLQVL